MTQPRKHIIRTLLFSFTILFLYTGCNQNQEANTDESNKRSIPTTIVPSKDILPPLVTTLQEPDVIALGKPIKHSKKKKASPNLIKKDFEFIQTEKIQLGPDHPKYPSTKPVHSQATLAKVPKHGVNASDWKTVKNNYLQLTEKEGLELVGNNGIFQDQKGNIWGCSREGGAWKYDGYQFVHYFKDTGLEDYSVVNLFFDRDGDVWFGMSFGLAKFDGSHFTHYTGEGEVSKNKPTKFVEDDYGNIWIGSMDGLYRLDKKQNTITHFTKENGLLDDEVSALYCDDSGQIWITYNQLGLALLSVDSTTTGYHYQFSNYKPNDISLFNNVQCLYGNNKGQFFIGTSRGFIQIYSNEIDSPKLLRASCYLGSPFIYAITEDHLGRLWLGTNLHLLLLNFNEDNVVSDMAIYTNENGLIASAVSGLAFDKENYLWTSHFETGITRIDLNQPFRSISADYGFYGDVIGGFEDKWKNVWFSINNVGIFCLRKPSDGSEAYLLQYKKEQNIAIDAVADMIIDDDGNIWIAGGGYKGKTYKNKVLKLELSNEGDKGMVHSYTHAHGLDLMKISDLMKDDQGAIWIAENTLSNFDKKLTSERGGVFKLDGNKLSYYGKAQGLMAPDTYSMCQDVQGNYWFNSLYYGLTKFEPTVNKGLGNWIHYKTGDLPSRITKHHSDGIWTNALFDIHHFSSTVDTPRQEVQPFIMDGYGLSSATINSYINTSYMKDVDNNIWIAHKDGLDKISTNETEGQANGKPVCYSYSKLDGLPTKATRNMFQTSDSTIYLTLSNELLSFQPGDLIKESKKQIVVLQNVLLFDEEIKWGKDKTIALKDQKVLSNFSFDDLSKWYRVPQNLSLTYRDNYIGFEYNAIEVNRQHKVDYRHYLEGYESGWNSASKNTKIAYPNLPHGNYTLNIAARIDAGEWGDSMKYTFEIRPPWWHSWWAYILYFLFVLTLLYSVYQFQLNRNLEKAEATRLKELDMVKTRLYTNITHEFRTPLTVISGMAAQVKEQPKEWFNEGLIMIERNANRLLNLVNQLLDLSKLESGKTALRQEQGDIVTYLKYLVGSIHSFAESKNIQLHFYADEEEVMMDYDPERIQQVIINLLSNAVKFTPSGGHVYMDIKIIQLSDKGGAFMKSRSLQITIRDNGLGIPEEQIPFIFDRFYQVDDSSTRQKEGSGIGLALVKELIILMKGEISVKSNVGKETIFTVTLPIRNEAPEIATSAIEPKSFNNTITKVSKNKFPLFLNGNVERLYNSKPEILLIEDNRDVVTYIATCLQGNYTIKVGNDGQEGIDIAFESIPDLIVTDVMMPFKDGFTVCKTLKNDERTSHIPIIMLTAKTDMESKLTGLGQGADAFLGKPFHKKELLIRIKKLLELRKKLHQYYLSIAASNTQEYVVEDHPEIPPADSHFMHKLKAIVELHLSDFELNIEKVCKELGMSQSQLHRKTTALTSLSPNKFIRFVRLNRAKTMLKNSGSNISEVAYDTGFNDPSYFGRVFKKEFGVTPQQWRESNEITGC